MSTEITGALAEIFREEISKKNKIKIEGLGTFRHEHNKQHQQQYKDGKVVMVPPKDVIKFIPEKRLAGNDDQ